MNKVELVVTGQDRSKGALNGPKTELTELEKAAVKATSSVEKSLKKLQTSADEAFDGLKDKFTKAAKDMEDAAPVKVKAELDKGRFESSLDGLGGFDIDVTSGIGPKLAAAFGKGIDLAGAGAKGASSFVGGLSEGIKGQHPAVQAAVYGSLAIAAATAAPLVGGALAGGIIAGFGAGIAGLGIVAAAQSGRVRDSFSSMWTGIVADTQARATVIEDVLVRTAGRAQTAWNQTGHVLSGAFSRVAPGLESLLDGLLQSFQRFAPALEPIASAASAVFDDLGDRLPGIVGEMADSFTSLADAVEENPEALGDFIALMGEFVEAGAFVVETLNLMHEGNKAFLDMISTPLEWVGLKDTGEAAGKVGRSMLEAAAIGRSPLKSLQEAIAGIGDAGEDSAAKADALRRSLDLLSGQAPDYTDALGVAAAAISGLDGAFKDVDDRAKGFAGSLLDAQGAFDVTNENGRLLYQGVTDVRDAFSDMGAAVADGQTSREQFITDAGRMRDRLNETWRQAGLSKDQIAELNYQYGLTPDQIATFVRLIGAADAEAQMNSIARARDAVIRIRQEVTTYGGWLGTGMGGQPIFHDRLPQRAHGGVSGGWTVVGENGPERVKLPGGSTVYPATRSQPLLQQQSFNSGGSRAGGGTRRLEWIGPPDIIQWLKQMVRESGGDPSVFGGGR